VRGKTLATEFDKPLQGRKRPERRSRTAFAPVAGVVLVAGAAALLGWTGLGRWQQFASPEPVVVAAPDVQTTGTVQAPDAVDAAPLDPARPNELSRTITEGGSAIITVRPSEDDEPGEGSIIVRDPSKLTQSAALAHMPMPELLEKTGERRLPRRSADGVRPFDAYARQWSGAAGPRIALVISGLGLSQTGTQRAIGLLDGEVTLAFATEGNSINRWMQEARRGGHEVLLQVPMEAGDGASPGRRTLETGAAPDENRERLHWALSRTTNYTGIMNFMGARFTAEEGVVNPLMAELSVRGLMYLDDGTSSRSRAREAAQLAAVPFAQADMVIDVAREPGAIMARLNDLEEIARSQGVAVGTGAAFDETVEAVARWMDEARRRGIEFVPVSAAAIDPERRG
jgi:polysaccharide deacetylase 2 family uncharacterized protein YibQ